MDGTIQRAQVLHHTDQDHTAAHTIRRETNEAIVEQGSSVIKWCANQIWGAGDDNR